MIENLPAKVDDVGRIVIPKKIRKLLNIDYNEQLLLSVKENIIEIKKEKEDHEFNKLKEKIQKIEKQEKLDFILANDYKIIFATENYKEYENIQIKKSEQKEITYCLETQITKEKIIKKPHYYSSLSFDNYTNGKLFVIFENQNEKEKAHLIINLLI